MSEETRDEKARADIKVLLHVSDRTQDMVQGLIQMVSKLQARVKALETYRHNQPPN